MYNFFNTGFKVSNFDHYFETSRKEHPLTFNQTEVVKYFEKDFKNSTFFKLFDNFNYPFSLDNQIKEYLNSNFENYPNKLQVSIKVCFMVFFNNDFQKSQFYKYFYHSTHNSQKNFTHVIPIELENWRVEKFVNNLDTRNEYFNQYFLVLVSLQIVLIFAVTILIFVFIKFYLVLVIIDGYPKEHIELIESYGVLIRITMFRVIG